MAIEVLPIPSTFLWFWRAKLSCIVSAYGHWSRSQFLDILFPCMIIVICTAAPLTDFHNTLRCSTKPPGFPRKLLDSRLNTPLKVSNYFVKVSRTIIPKSVTGIPLSLKLFKWTAKSFSVSIVWNMVDIVNFNL